MVILLLILYRSSSSKVSCL